MFAEVFKRFRKSLVEHTSSSKDKEKEVPVNNPEVFTGESPMALRPFLGQCEMVFQARPNTYSTDEMKITYIASYFRKTAQDWWQPFLLDSPDNLPTFMTNYLDFLDELHAQFGPVDPEGEAEEKLDQLRMAEHHRVSKYAILFTSLAAQTRYEEFALYRIFYKGLASRIKDELIRLPTQPETLAEVRSAALRIDGYYWKRQNEKKYEGAPKSSKKPQEPSTSQNTSSRKQQSNSTQASNNSNSSRKSSNNEIAAFLGPDGRLLPEERERRIKEGLCLICAKKGHLSKTCPSRKPAQSAEKAKGRGTSTNDSNDSNKTDESSKKSEN